MGKSIFAGILISLGALGYVACGGIIGSVLFAFGLVCIVGLDIPLYTGVAGVYNYQAPYTKDSFINLKNVLIGNIIGCFIVSIFTRLSGLSDLGGLSAIAWVHYDAGFGASLGRAILCGIIIDVAVYLAKNTKLSYLGILLGVPLFINLGGLHSIADTYYIFMSSVGCLSWKILWFFPTVIIGNFIGCNLRKIFFNPTKSL